MNVLTICGNLGKDCRTGEAGGTFVANFSVAIREGYGDKAKTHWVECAYWGKGAQAVAQYLKKGQQVVVSGELGLKPADGQYQAALTCRVSSLTLCGKREQSGEQPRQATQAAPAAAAAPEGDDIPF